VFHQAFVSSVSPEERWEILYRPIKKDIFQENAPSDFVSDISALADDSEALDCVISYLHHVLFLLVSTCRNIPFPFLISLLSSSQSLKLKESGAVYDT